MIAVISWSLSRPIMSLKINNIPDWLTSLPVAYRGLAAASPENSLAAFEKALHAGFAIALDIKIIHDLEVIVFSDDSLHTAYGRKQVSTLVKSDLQLAHYTPGTKIQVPLLPEVFRLVDEKVPLFIHIDHQPDIPNYNLLILNTLLRYNGPLAIFSMDTAILSWFAGQAPLIPRGLLFNSRKLPLFWRGNPDFLLYDASYLPNLRIEKKRQKGIPVFGWSVSNDEERERIRSFCDNMVFKK
jgi:glycerophosphoryl diester phosphodiesterase